MAISDSTSTDFDLSLYEEEMDFGQCEATAGAFVFGIWFDSCQCQRPAVGILRLICKCGHDFTRASCKPHMGPGGYCRHCAPPGEPGHLCPVAKSSF